MLKVSVPIGTGNRGIKDGSLPKLIESVMERLHPESGYFFAENGKRTMLMVFDLKDVNQIPSVVEPLFLGLDAEVNLTPVMNADDLREGLQASSKLRT